jgi:Zn-dependent protease with chaperone function
MAAVACDSAGMGVAVTKSSRLDRLRERIAERIETRLYDRVTRESPVRPKRGAAGWASLTVALVVHGVTLGCVLLGGWWILGVRTPVFVVAGIALLCLAILMRPRLGRIPRDAVVLDPAAAPRLFTLVNRVADRLGARPVRLIVLDARFNAAVGDVGLRRRRVLWLGYPLWNVLNPAGRLGLLGHELGHCVNGDLRRGLVVGSSLSSLVELYRFLRDGPGRSAGGSVLVEVAEVAARLLMRLLSWPLLAIILIQERLLAQSGQRAEYYADQLAVRLAGARAVVSALETTDFADACLQELHTAVIRRDPDIWAACRAWLAEMSTADRERILERAGSERPRVDATHPPTRLRIAAIGVQAQTAETLQPDGTESDAIDAELRGVIKAVTEDIRARAIG